MNTTPGLFGSATAFQAPAPGSDANSNGGPLETIRRHVQNVLLGGGHGSGTTSASLSVVAVAARSRTATVVAPVAPTACIGVPGLLERIRAEAGLTLEEIAHLMGVSRRSVHNWKNGETVSSGNEVRLRDLDQSIRRIAASTHMGTVRERLMSCVDGGLRPYDLLAEGRNDVAVSTATGVPPIAAAAPDRAGLDAALAARLEPVIGIEPIGQPMTLRRRLRSARS